MANVMVSYRLRRHQWGVGPGFRVHSKKRLKDIESQMKSLWTSWIRQIREHESLYGWNSGAPSIRMNGLHGAPPQYEVIVKERFDGTQWVFVEQYPTHIQVPLGK